MRCLVTGGNGFLGSALCRMLVAHGHTVRALLRPGTQAANLEGVAVELAYGDITDESSLAPALEGVDWLFHTAGLYSLSDDDALHARVNVLGTRNVLAAAARAGVARAIVTGSATNVGSAPADGHATEDGLWDLGALNIPYYTSKFLAEAEALRAGARGLDVVLVEPATLVGERDRPDSPSGRWLIEFLNGRLLAVPPIEMNVVDVDDAARLHLLAAERGARGERYLATNWNTTAEGFFTKAGGMVGRRPPLVVPYEVAFAGAAVGGAVLELLGVTANVSASLIRYAHKRMHYANAKAVRELGFEPTPIDQTLEKAIRWLNASPHVKRRL